MSNAPMPEPGRSLFERAAAVYDFAAAAKARRPVEEPDSAPTPSPVRHFAANRQGRIDRDAMAAAGFATLDDGITATAEEFRLVKRQLLQAATADDAGPRDRLILVASACPGEGKTFCAVNLAVSIAAEKDFEVLLVDGDVARPSIPALLGLEDGPGLMDAIADPRIDVEGCIVRTDIPNLSVLPAGSASNDATELLASDRTRIVLDQLATQRPNRILLFDSPPALAASPASELAHHVGRVVMIVRADATSEADLRAAIALLGGCRDVRLLLNATTMPGGSRRFGDYHAQ